MKFLPKSRITQIFLEVGFINVKVQTLGRIPTFARSMIVMGSKPE